MEGKDLIAKLIEKRNRLISELKEVERYIQLIKKAEWQREWRRKNPDKKMKSNAEWNKYHRNEYQRIYRQNKKK